MKTCPQCNEDFEPSTRFCPHDGSMLHSILDNLDPLIGETIDGKYRIVSRIGFGGMSTVYTAIHLMMERTVAIKLLRANLATPEEETDEFLKRFQREARTASSIEHPNAVTIYDFGIFQQTPYLVMQFIEGIELSEALEDDNRLPLKRVLNIVFQICSAVAAAHRQGIVHRDLKPGNIMLSTREDGAEHVTVLDFGLAKFLKGNEHGTTTQTGAVLGTPLYMAPEQAEGEQVDARCDIYSLGVILYQMLSGKLPFESENPVELIIKHIAEVPDPLRELRPELRVLGGLDQAVMKALEKDPEKRQQTVLELAASLNIADPTVLDEFDKKFASGSLPPRAFGAPRWRINAISAGLGVALLATGFLAYPVLLVPTPEEIQAEQRRQEAKRYIEEGARLVAEQKHQRALSPLKMALQIDPGSALANFHFGHAYIQMGLFKNAIPPLEDACRLDPTFTQAFIKLGEAHYRLANRDKARTAYRAALKLDPKNRTIRETLKLLKDRSK